MKCMPFWKGCNRNVDYIDHSHRCLTVVPDEVLRCSRTLEELLLDSNQIRDLPQSFFSLTQLRKLSMNDNQITRLTNDIGSLTNLQELDVSHNELMHIPESIKQCKNLQIANFSSNPLKDLPAGLTQLKNLTHLILNDVAIRKLPEEIGSLTNLEFLELRDNLISQFPSSLSRLVNLQFLDAGSNMIEEVPEFFGSLCNLEELRLDCNEILELPTELGDLKKLTQLDMSENSLKQLPQEIGGLTNLTDLHLSQNQLEYLPDGIGSLRNLCTLKVDQNHLVQLTPAVGNCSALQELILTENLLTDLPGTVGKLKSLAILNVDRNRLTNIPSKIGGCVNLGVLSLRENVLLRLPPELGFLKELHVLDVSGNRLQHLPLSLGTCNLKALWLSENQAQPLLKFQQDVDEETGEKVLTCFLLPQQAFTDSMENLLKDSFAVMSDHDSRFSWLDNTRGSSVKFAEDDRDQDSDEDAVQQAPGSLSGDENHFVRHNTPHPKDLRVRHNKLFIKDVDGHMIPHKQKREPDLAFVRSRNHDGFSVTQQETLPNSVNTDGHEMMQNKIETNERRNRDTASDAKDIRVNSSTQILSREDGTTDARKSEHDLDGLNETDHLDGRQNAVPAMPNAKQMTIHIVRSPGTGLGISIAGGLGSHPFLDDDEGIFISKVNCGGIAEKEGLLVGDKILSVNGINMENVEHSRAVAVLRTAGYDVTLVIIRTSSFNSQEETNATNMVQDTTLDFSCVSATPSMVMKVGSSSLEIVDSSDSRRPPDVAAGSFRSPDDILKKPERNNESSGAGFEFLGATELSSASGSSALPSVLDERRPGWGKTGPLPKDVRLKNLLPENNHTPVRESNGLSSISSSSSTLTSINHSPRVKSASPQCRAKDTTKAGDVSTAPESASTKTITLDSNLPPASSGVQSEVASSYPKETVVIVKAGGPLGLSIVGGRGHTSHPFGIDEPGIFISKIQPHGTAAKALKLKIGDRILAVNGQSMENASHEEAVMALVAPTQETVLDVRHDPQPTGLKEVVVHKAPGERLGLSIAGGAGTPCGNAADTTDEGIFISRITPGTVVARDGRLSVGMRILEVNGQSLLGTTQQEAAQMLQAAGSSLDLLLCHGFDVAQSRPSSLTAGRRVSSKEIEILTPSLSKASASVGLLHPTPGSSAKTVFDKSTKDNKAIASDPSSKLAVTSAELSRNGAINNVKPNDSTTVDSNSYPSRPVDDDARSALNDASESVLRLKPVSAQNLSAEDDRRMRAEQRRMARLKFLQEAATKAQETSKVLMDFPHNNIRP